MKFRFPAASFANATTIICCWRSSRTRQALADISAQLALMFSDNRSIAESASGSKDALYGSVLMRAMAGLNRSLRDHNASAAYPPDRYSGLTELSGFPSTFSAKLLNNSKLKFFIEGSPVGFSGCVSQARNHCTGCNPHLYSDEMA